MSKKFKELDVQFEQFLDSVLIEARNIDLTEEKKAARRAKADVDDIAFCEIYYPQIFFRPWLDFHLDIAAIKSGMWTLSGFRKCGKSAVVYFAKVIKSIALDIGGIISINCDTLEISKERTAALKRIIMKNRVLCYDYDIKLIQDLKGWYIFGKTFMIAGSVKHGLRNLLDDEMKRIRIAVNDDLYDRYSVTSENHNQNVFEFIESEVRGQLEDGGLSITMGNSLSETCAIVKLKEAHPNNHLGLPALDEKEESTWPEYKSKEEWDEFRNDTPYDIWMGEYMDQPSVDGGEFKPEMFRPVNINTISILASISVCDPSYGKSTSACDKGLVTGGITSSREVIYSDVYVRKDDYPFLFDYLNALIPRTKNWKSLFFENDFSQWAFAEPFYKDWMKERNKTIPIVLFNSKDSVTEFRGADKQSRIIGLIHPHKTSMIKYDENCMKGADWNKYKGQAISFGKAEGKLDGLDAAASLFILIFRYLATGHFQSMKKRVFEKLSWEKASWR